MCVLNNLSVHSVHFCIKKYVIYGRHFSGKLMKGVYENAEVYEEDMDV